MRRDLVWGRQPRGRQSLAMFDVAHGRARPNSKTLSRRGAWAGRFRLPGALQPCVAEKKKVYLRESILLKPWAVRVSPLLASESGCLRKWYPQTAPIVARGSNLGCGDSM